MQRINKQGVLLFLITLVGCNQENSVIQIEASACASQLSNGQIVECESNNSKFSEDIKKFEKIDSKFPEIKSPNSEIFIPILVSKTGEIKLSDGKLLKLAGLDCNHQDLKKFMTAFTMSDKTGMKYVETGFKDEKYIYVYAWDINIGLSESMNRELNGNVFLPTYSSINETAITSKWCKPIQQKNHTLYDRYIEIYNTF